MLLDGAATSPPTSARPKWTAPWARSARSRPCARRSSRASGPSPERGNLITDGRDQGTVVFPDADLKFYFTGLAGRAGEAPEARPGEPGASRSRSSASPRKSRPATSADSRRQHSPLRPPETPS
ncbi:MAG: (d)CMP kinase [Rhodopseudomonas palustris]|nr:(d)CMP kinase [Rhodopseudomonas palustris]